jgi:integrase
MADKRRRRRGSGSVYQDKTGQWWAKVALGNGRTRRARATSRKDAEAKAKALSQSADAGIDLVSSQQRTQAWLETWLTTKQTSVRPKTQQFYQLMCEYATAHIGNVALEALTATHIRVMLSDLIAAGLSPHSTRHVLTVVRMALDVAVRDGLITKNPARQVDPPRVKAYHGHVLSEEEQAQLLAACADERQGLLIEVALRLGLRRGELIALRWKDIDWHKRLIAVAFDSDGKTDAASRWLPLTSEMIARLRTHQAQQREEAALLGERWRDHGLVFPSEVGTPLGERNLTRLFKRLLRKAGLPESIRLHDLRGTAITDWIADGADVKAAQSGAGHASAATTLKYYAQARAENLRRAVEEAERRRTDTDTVAPPRSGGSSAAA